MHRITMRFFSLLITLFWYQYSSSAEPSFGQHLNSGQDQTYSLYLFQHGPQIDKELQLDRDPEALH